MLAGPKPRIFTFLSATSVTDKSAMLVNLSASLASSGSDVVLLDACMSKDGITRRMGVEVQATLLDVALSAARLESGCTVYAARFWYRIAD